MQILRKAVRKAQSLAQGRTESVFRSFEAQEISRATHLNLVPPRQKRGGGLGTLTYAEYCWTIGLFQPLIYQNLPSRRPGRFLDIGCGVGRLYLATRPYLETSDEYIGLDVTENSIRICQDIYKDETAARFVHFDVHNAYYAGSQSSETQPYPFDADSFDLVTALSVWTHLRESDWRFYLNEVGRILRPEGRAILTFFVVDPETQHGDRMGTAAMPEYSAPDDRTWTFDTPAYDSQDWLYPAWAAVPEVAIGVRKPAFEAALEAAGLKTAAMYPGAWRQNLGLFFQDIVVLEKMKS